jgi:hypothetical protein
MTKSGWVLLSIVLMIITTELFKDRTVCTVQGKIHPAMALRKIWVIQNGDTIPTSFATNTFKVKVKRGKYIVWIDAVAPYQDVQIDNIASDAEKNIELGNIELVQ